MRAWFSVFPREDWGYYCFAILLPMLALWITWQLAARYLPPDKCVLGIALLTFVPFCNFRAIKLHANTCRPRSGQLATWWFLRSFETRRIRWAVLAGVAAAAAMLAKYWFITLLAGLAVAALTDPRRNAYFSSPAPCDARGWNCPFDAEHLLTYDARIHAFFTMRWRRILKDCHWWYFRRSSSPSIVWHMPWQRSPYARWRRGRAWPRFTTHCGRQNRSGSLVIAFAAPFGFVTLIAVLVMVAIESIWVAPEMTHLLIVLLSSPLIVISRLAAVRLLALAVVFTLLILAVSPLVALVLHLNGVPGHSSDYRAVAEAVERVWRAHADKLLRIVGSTFFVNGILFYFKDQTSTLDVNNPKLTPWVSVDRIESEGAVIVCPETDAFCIAFAARLRRVFHVAAD